MSKEYIDKSKLLDDVDILIRKEQEQSNINSALYALQFVKALIDSTSAADVAEVVHGEWLENDGRCYCNRCFEFSCTVTDDTGTIHNDLTKFCPNCGAKMDGGKRENK